MEKAGHLGTVLAELKQGGCTPLGILSVESEPGHCYRSGGRGSPGYSQSSLQADNHPHHQRYRE